MKLGESYSLMKEKLLVIYSNSEAEIVVSWTFEHFTGFSTRDMRFKQAQELTEEQNNQLSRALHELLKHKPVQYVLGEAWFYGLKFCVNESVLIPRPETEELVEWIINESRKIDNQLSNIKHLQILDIGTGSGCIPISLKKKIPNAEITSVDISDKALFIAQQNAIHLNADIKLIALDFLDENSWNKLDKYDIVVSNPPYIPLKEKNNLDKNVAIWEPSLALFVTDNDPVIFYRKISQFAKLHLKENGILFLEIHQDFTLQTTAQFDEQGFVTKLKKDINGNNRMLKVSYK